MCGIFGFVSNQIKNHGEFRHFANQLAIESRYRGTDATGFASVADGEVFTDKRPVSSFTFQRISDMWRAVFERDSIGLIGHTRAATSGTPANNENNHPFHNSKYSIVHNGMIGQFKSAAFKRNFKLVGECDSEIIAHMLNPNLPIEDSVVDFFNEFDDVSSFAIAAINRSNGEVFLFRNNDSPCVLATVSKFNAVVFASTARIIHDAYETATNNKTVAIKEISDIPSYHLYKISPDGKVTSVNLKDRITSNTSKGIYRRVSSWEDYRRSLQEAHYYRSLSRFGLSQQQLDLFFSD